MLPIDDRANLVVIVFWAVWLLYWFVSAFGNKAVARADGWASFLAYRVPLVEA